MGIDAEAWRMGYAAHRDGLHDQYDRAVRSAHGDTYAKAWLSGWYAYHA